MPEVVPDLSNLGAKTTLWELEQRTRRSEFRPASRNGSRENSRREEPCPRAEILEGLLKDVQYAVDDAEEQKARSVPSRDVLKDLVDDIKNVLSKVYQE